MITDTALAPAHDISGDFERVGSGTGFSVSVGCSIACRSSSSIEDGFDHIFIGDEEPVMVPNGWDRYLRCARAAVPGGGRGVDTILRLCREAFHVLEYIDERGLQFDSWGGAFCREVLTFRFSPIAVARFLARARWTLQDAFDAVD